MTEEKKNIAQRFLLKGSNDKNWYKTCKVKGYAIGIYSKTSKYAKKNILLKVPDINEW